MTVENRPDNTDPNSADATQPLANSPDAATGAKGERRPTKTPPPRRRRWPYVVVGILLLLIVLVLLIPTIASSGPVRSFIVGKINDNLNGRVEIADWSLSWTGGIQVNGVRVFDDRNSQIAQIEFISTELSLLDAARGNFILGDTNIRGADGTVIQNPDGSINFADLAKSSDKPDEPGDLPNISGNIRIDDSRGTFVRNTGDPATSQRVKMSNIAATLAISNINEPIVHTMSVTAAVNDGPAGTLTIKGKADVVTDRRVNLAAASFDETIELKNLDGAAISAFVPPDVIRQMGGTLNGTIVAQSTDGKTVTIRSQIDGQNVVLATAAFAPGEAYRSQTLTLLVPVTMSLPNGLADLQVGTVRTDGPISLTTEHIQFSVAADAPIATLLSVASNQTPMQPGKINQMLGIDVPPVAGMLPRTLGLRPGAKLDSGRLEQSITADMSSGQSQLSAAVKVTQIEGSSEVVNAQGRTVRRRFAVKPIAIEVATGSHGGGWKAPDLRDLKLEIDSGFAGGEFVAPTLASLKGSIDADLAKFKSELGQFFALDDVPLQGTINITADSTGDPTRPAEPAKFGVTVTGTNIHTEIAGKAIRQPLVRASVNGTLLRTQTGELKQISEVILSAITGSATTPTIDVQISAPMVHYVPPAGDQAARYDVPSFTIARANVALAPAQNDLGLLIPAMSEYDISDGIAAVKGTGSYLNGALHFDATVATNNLDFGRYLATTQSVPGRRVRQGARVLADYSLTADVAATYQPLPGGGATLSFAKLQVKDDRDLLSLGKSGELVVTLPQDGPPTAAGTLNIGLDLVQAQDLARRWSATTGNGVADAGNGDKPVMIRNGRLTGTIGLSQHSEGGLAVSLNAGVDALTLAGNEAIVTDEKVTLTLKAAAGAELATAAIEQLQLTSGIATVNANGRFVLKTGEGEQARSVPLLQMVRALSATITTPDVAKLQDVLGALQSPRKPPVTMGPPAPAQLAAADPRLPPGTPLPDAATPAEPAMLEQITEIRVTELAATGIGATVGLKQPIVATSPAKLLELFAGQPASPAPQPKVVAAPAGQPPATQPAPPPPAKLAGGSATIKLDITGDGQTLTIVPDVQAQELALSVGEARRDIGDLALRSKMIIVPRPEGAPAAGANPTLAGAFTINGQIAPLMELSAFLGGEKPQSGYAGALSFEQTIGTEGTVIKLAGGGAIADFVVRDAAGKPAFTEKTVRIADDLSLDTSGTGALALSRIAVVFETSGALNLEANGKINDFRKTRTIEYVLANVSYDAAKVWQILRPMLADPQTPPEQDPYKDYVVEGKATRQFALAGSFPAVDDAGNPVPTAVALRSLAAHGSIALDMVQAEGLIVQSIELPVSLNAGIVKVIDVAKPAGEQLPAPYACNGGTINVAGIEIDLNQDVPLFSMPSNLQILNKVQLNPALANFLGGLVNNPLFVPSAETKGIVDATIVECRDVPVGKRFKVQSGNNGYAVATFNFSGAQFKNDFIVGLTNGLDKLVSFKLDPDSWQGSIRNGKVTYKSGYVGHDMTLVLGEQQEKSIRLYGNTRLSDNTMIPMTMLFSSDWFGGDFEKYVPKGLPVALTGPFTAPRYDLAQAVQATIRQNYFSGKPEDVGRIIDLFTNRKKDDTPAAPGADPATKPAAKPKQDPIGIIGDLLGQAAKERERKEQEKKERERRESQKKQR